MHVPQELMWTFHLPLKFENPQDLAVVHALKWLVMEIYQEESLLHFKYSFLLLIVFPPSCTSSRT